MTPTPPGRASARPRARRVRLLALLAAALVAAPAAATLPGTGAAEAATTSLTQRGAPWTVPYGPWRTDGHTESFSSPAVGDVTGDGVPEVIAGGMDGRLFVFALDGRRLLDRKVGTGPVTASPLLVDADGDGVLDVLAATEGDRSTQMPGVAEIVTGSGRVLFRVTDDCSMPRCGFIGTPSVGDLDGDGRLDVVATSTDHRVHAWRLDGSRHAGFPRFVFDTIWSSPTLADLDADGRQEIVFGGDMDSYPGQPYPTGGLVWVIRADGRDQPGWPRTLPGQVIWSSPAVVDLDGNGRLDVVVGTGLNFPDPAGHRVHALDSSGRHLPGWPVVTQGQVMASPAIGDLDGDGRLDVAVLSEGGWVTAHRADGSLLWSRCNRDSLTACAPGVPTHGAVSIADVDADGQQEVVGAAEHHLRVLDGRTGAVEAERVTSGQAWAPGSAPTIAEVQGQTWVIQQVTLDTRADGRRGDGDSLGIYTWTTGTRLGRADWPTARHDMLRTGTLRDTTPPSAGLDGLPGSASTTEVPVRWSGEDTGSGIARFDVDVREGSGAWVRWVSGAGPSARSGARASGGATLWARAGTTYEVRVRATDVAGTVGAWSPTGRVDVAAGARRVQPVAGAYAVSRDGDVAALSSPPAGGPGLPGIGRDVAARAQGGGYVLDGWGGVHALGGAPALRGAGYWPRHDVARAIALNPDGAGGLVLDALGGLHPLGATAKPAGAPYFGFPIARDLVLAPDSTAAAPRGWVLDGFGGVHPFGGAPRLTGGAYWRGQDLARGLTVDPAGRGGQLVDAYGGLHPLGAAPRVAAGGYWPGWDVVRGVASGGEGRGWVLDGYGGLHAYGGAAPLSATRYWGRDVARGLSVVP